MILVNDIHQTLLNKKIWLYILALLIIIDARSIYMSDYALGKLPNYLVLASSLLCVCMIIFSQGIVQWKYIAKAFRLCVLAGIFLLILYLVKPFNINVNIQWLLRISILLLYFIVCQDNRLSLLTAYKNIMVFIAIESLFFWLYGSLVGIIEHTGYLYSTWAANENEINVCPSYYGIYFETQRTNSFDNAGLVRNTAIFTEAPMASMNFSIALMVEYLLKKKPYMPFVIALCLAVFSTVSTTGYMVLLLLLIFKLIMYPVHTMFWKITKFFGLPIATIIIAAIGIYVLADKQDTMSFLLRVDDFIVGYNTWIESPLFGWGAGNTYPLQQHMDFWRARETGFSNSVFWILAQGGIYLGLPYIVSAIYVFTNMYKLNEYKALCFMFVYLIMLSVTIAPFVNITFVVFISLLMYTHEKKLLASYR